MVAALDCASESAPQPVSFETATTWIVAICKFWRFVLGWSFFMQRPVFGIAGHRISIK
jgi:hypothetical protein